MPPQTCNATVVAEQSIVKLGSGEPQVGLETAITQAQLLEKVVKLCKRCAPPSCCFLAKGDKLM